MIFNQFIFRIFRVMLQYPTMNLLHLAKASPFNLEASSRQLWQVAVLISFWWLSQCLTDWLHLPIPGSLLGLLLLWTLLECNVLPVNWFEHGADSLLKHLMLFFVPAMLALVDHPEFMSMLGLKLVAVVLISTIIVMAGTASVVELGFRMRHASNC